MTALETSVARRDWTPILAGGLVMGLALGARHVQGLFLIPMTMDRGWDREIFSQAIALQNLAWGLCQPLSGWLSDRFGALWIIAGGLILYCLGLAGMVYSASEGAFLLAAGVCVGIAQSGTTFGVVYAALSRTVRNDRRSWALGLAGALGGMGQFVMVPVSQMLIDMTDWQTALLIFSGAAAVMLPLVFAFGSGSTSKAEATHQGGPGIADALRHKGFWLLNLGFLVCGFQLTFAQTYLPSYVSDSGLDASVGVMALALMALFNVAGTYLFGLWGGTYRKKNLLVGIYLARTATISLFLLLPMSGPSIYAFSAALGFLLLGTVPLTNGLVSQVFGVRYIGTLFGILFLNHQIGSFIGVRLGGIFFEAYGSYQLGWAVAAALGLVAAALHWPINDSPFVASKTQKITG